VCTAHFVLMSALFLHEFHIALKARFVDLNGQEAVGDYGDAPAEHAALQHAAGVLDLSFRGRICLTGSDRVRFLHGQVTNDILRLRAGEGCYAAIVSAKGKMESDCNVYCLAEELLLDLEPGMGGAVTRRLERYIVADDVQVVDAAPNYGMLSVQGPESGAAVRALGLFAGLPSRPFDSLKITDATLGEMHVVNQPRLRAAGYDLYVPLDSLGAVGDKLIAAARGAGGRACGWQAFETARIEAGIPRFGIDMDERNLPLECGIEQRAVSYSKGCYIGQEVINRLHTLGHVNRELSGLRLADDLPALPVKDDKLFSSGKEAGYITSAIVSAPLNATLALGYVRTEVKRSGLPLTLRHARGESPVQVVELPFQRPDRRPAGD
jgi:folate-binding protein YgfZ